MRLACYPPYHSKYNPVKRVFGVLENYWNGDPLLTVEHALGMAAGMTYKGVHPVGFRLPQRRPPDKERDDSLRRPAWFGSRGLANGSWKILPAKASELVAALALNS